MIRSAAFHIHSFSLKTLCINVCHLFCTLFHCF
nr:MAG TPA: hypothetical protein [Caudoviricetes sp.]